MLPEAGLPIADHLSDVMTSRKTNQKLLCSGLAQFVMITFFILVIMEKLTHVPYASKIKNLDP